MKGIINRRRLLATLLLVTAITMIVAGETIFKHRHGPVATLVYWTGCLLATLGAACYAMLDLIHSARESRTKQRAMLEQTLHEIEAERDRRAQFGKRQPPESR
jgi:hypothetical protein